MPNKANTRQHANRKSAYETQRRRTESNKLARARRQARQKIASESKRQAPKASKIHRDETNAQREIRHSAHFERNRIRKAVNDSWQDWRDRGNREKSIIAITLV